jgi:hypothetical protein
MAAQTPSNKQLTITDLRTFRVEILKAYTEGTNKAEEEFEKGNLSQSQFNTAANQLQKLKIQATELLGLIMASELDALLNTTLDSPATKIGIATKNLQDASQKIQNFLDFLQSIAEVVRITAGLIVALQTGSTANI